MKWNGKRIDRWCHRNLNITKTLKEIVTGENYIYDNGCESVTVTLLQNHNSFYFLCLYLIHISANMSPFGYKFSQMILHTEARKLMYIWSFLFVVLHKPTLLPSTFKCFKKVKIDKWPDLSYSFSPIDCCVRINGKPGRLFSGDIQS